MKKVQAQCLESQMKGINLLTSGSKFRILN